MPFRCSAASLDRDEPLGATASTVRAFLLVENPGPWGVDALVDARMDERVRAHLLSAERVGVRALLVRRHRGSAPSPGTRVFAAYAHPARPWLEAAALATPGELLDLDLAALGAGRSPGGGLARVERPVFCVCTQGRHDACCAELGRPTVAALTAAHPEETWEVSHIGGDRFAANVLVLPTGLYYGRVPPAEAADLGRRHLEGRLSLDLLRGRSGFGFAVQAAELALRRRLGETRTDAVRLVSVSASDTETSARLQVDDAAYDVRVRRSREDRRSRLTCRAVRDNAVWSYDVVAITPV
jgi:hypothetical protein